MITNYRDLVVWQKAMDLVTFAYRLARELPASELYGLRSQIQRAAVSIPANIAEGQGRDQKDKAGTIWETISDTYPSRRAR